MSSSGARSGTKPSRASRGAGDGSVGAVKLACGHDTHSAPVAVFPSRRKLWSCPEGCGLQERG